MQLCQLPSHGLVAAIGFLVFSAPTTVFSATLEATPSNYRKVLRSLKPGDTMVLAPGIYTHGIALANVHGTADHRITVRGPNDGSALFVADDCCNTVQLDTVSHVTISHLTLDGMGTHGAFGVHSRGPCHDITIENLDIMNYGAHQQVVGISTKGPAWNWIIRHNRISGAGTGMYLGNSDGTQPFVNGLIEYNLVTDTIGYNLQIKHQKPRPADVGLPTGESRTVIRHNVWSKQNNASVAEMARPNVLVGHFPVEGSGSNDRYEIYGNLFYQNPTEALFQGEGNIVLHDNVFVNHHGDAVNIQAHHDRPRRIDVYHNTVVAAGGGIRVSGADDRYTQTITGNAVFAGTPIVGPNQSLNVSDTFSAATSYLMAPLAPIGQMDLAPQAGRLSGPEIDLTRASDYLDGARDFNGRTRTGSMRGAYAMEGPSQGWPLSLSIKQVTGP